MVSKGPSWSRPPVPILLIACLMGAVAVSRVTLVVLGIDAVYFDEELATGLLGTHLVEGLRAPLFDYQLDAHHPARVWMGIIAAPLFAVFGNNLFVLKLAPMSMHVAAVALWFHCCDRYLGRREAILVGLLFVVPPTVLARFSVVAMGYHADSLVFTAAAVLAFFHLLRDRERRDLWCGMFGIVSGCGISYTYIFAPTLATALVLWCVADRRFLRTRGFAIFLAAALVGLVPWIASNVGNDWGGATWLAQRAVGLDLVHRANALISFLTTDLYRSFALSFDGVVERQAVRLFYASVVFVSYLDLCVHTFRSRAVRPALEHWLLLYPWVFAVFYAANINPEAGTGFIRHYGYQGYRYFGPLYPVLFVIVAIALNRSWIAGGLRARLARVTAAALILVGLSGLSHLLSANAVGRAFAYKSYSYKEFAFQRGERSPLDVSDLSGIDKAYFLLGRGWRRGQALESAYQAHLAASGSATAAHAGLSLAKLDEAYRRDAADFPLTTSTAVLPTGRPQAGDGASFYCLLLGAALAEAGPASTDTLAVLRDAAGAIAASAVTDGCRSQAYLGLGTTFPMADLNRRFEAAVEDDLRVFVEAFGQLPDDARGSAFEGLGQGVGVKIEFTFLRRLDVILGEIERQVPEALKARVYVGYGRGIAWRFGEDPNHAADLMERVAPPYQPDARQGYDQFMARLAPFY